MKTYLVAIGLSLLGTACSKDANGPSITPPDSTFVVSMSTNTFTPFTTTISVGKFVIFDFGGEPHNVIFNRVNGAPADIQETRNQRVTRTFNVVGTFPYDCTIHPGMSAVVIVR